MGCGIGIEYEFHVKIDPESNKAQKKRLHAILRIALKVSPLVSLSCLEYLDKVSS